MNCPNCNMEINSSSFSIFNAMRREFKCKKCNNLYLIDYPRTYLWLFNTLPSISSIVLVGLTFLFRDIDVQNNYVAFFIIGGYVISSLILRFFVSKRLIKKMVLKEWKFQ